MSKQIAFVLTGLTLAMSSVGCCCLGGYGYNRCAPCNTGCPPTGGGYYTPQTMYQSYDASSTAYLSGTTQTTAIVPSSAIMGAPIMASPGGGYTTTALVPTNSLPTF